MKAREELNKAPQVEEVVDDEPAEQPSGKVTNLPTNSSAATPTPVRNLKQPEEPKIEDQKFKRVAIVEDSDSEEEEQQEEKKPEPEPVKESKPLITEISSSEAKNEKKTSSFLTDKDSNYSQFDMSKVQTKKKVEEDANDPTAKIRREIEELEAKRKENRESVDRIAAETQAAKEQLEKAKADYEAASKKQTAAAAAVDETIQKMKNSGELDALNKIAQADGRQDEQPSQEPVKE